MQPAKQALLPALSPALSLLFHAPLLKKSKQKHLFLIVAHFLVVEDRRYKAEEGDWTWEKIPRDQENCACELAFGCSSL